jgi:hypothetical protein
MQSRSKLWIGMVVLSAALLGVGHTAWAKSMWAMTTDQNPNAPSGTTYSSCDGATLFWTNVDGFDTGGAVVCFSRSYSNNSFVQATCQSSAGVNFRSNVRSTGATYCTGPTNPWGGTISACHVVLFGKTSQSSTCGQFDLGVWGRGL